MEKFENYEYKHLDFDVLDKQYNELVEKFENAKTGKAQVAALKEINALNVEIDTVVTLCSIRFSQNVNDKYYAKDRDYLDEYTPKFSAVSNRLDKAILNSKFKTALTKEFGPRLVLNAEQAAKTFKPEIIEDMVEDNKLCSQYDKLLGSAKVKFRGKTYNLYSLGKFQTDPDRKTRAAASRVINNWFAKHLEELDTIYDNMVHVRDRMAKKLGFKNYVELGYLNLNRTDFTPEDIKNYRDALYKYVVPVTKKLFRSQAKRLGIKGMKHYDYNLEFNSGNATPKGNKDELVAKASKMYKEMSPETDEFFTFMKESNLLDLEARQGKRGGGYTTIIPKYKAPFIFSNFNGTSADVDVLTHEAGHAFMAFRCRDVNYLAHWWPTIEACEIHSMSMEFFAYPWMELFFEEQTDKYKFSHLASAVTFLPYGAAVDEFQTFVYENPDLTPVERRAKWREIEKKYLPHIKYGNNKFLNDGGRWMRQTHIFTSPLYYIDYTIAQICAFQFFNLMNKDYKDAWNRYVNLCNLGGSTTFLKLIGNKNVKIESPFKKGVIRKTIKPIQAYLDQFDDQNM